MGLGDWGRHLFYSSMGAIDSAVERANAKKRWQYNVSISDDERMVRIHLTALFTSRVIYACRQYGVTPWSSDTKFVDLDRIMNEAEAELGLVSGGKALAMLPPNQRDEARRLSKERRQHAYSVFLRQTSDASYS